MANFLERLGDAIYDHAPDLGALISSVTPIPSAIATMIIKFLFEEFNIPDNDNNALIEAIKNDPDSATKILNVKNKVDNEKK